MAQIILDFGSANTCKNDIEYVKRMIDELVAVDTKKHEVILKWQLFEKAGDNIPLNWGVFKYAYEYAKEKGYKTTASVFDLKSLKYLLNFKIPFVKIANREDLYWLAGEIPRKIPVYISIASIIAPRPYEASVSMACVSKYPASLDDYKNAFDNIQHFRFISDHTENWDLYNLTSPYCYECHYKLPDSTGLDAGSFARTPEQLKEIL